MESQIEELKTAILMQFFMVFSIICTSLDNSQVLCKCSWTFKCSPRLMLP